MKTKDQVRELACYNQVAEHMQALLLLDEDLLGQEADLEIEFHSSRAVLDVGVIQMDMLGDNIVRLTMPDDSTCVHDSPMSMTRAAANGNKQVFVNIDYKEKVNFLIDNAHAFRVDDYEGVTRARYNYQGNFDD